jgi:uncharacterized protein
VLAGPCHTSCRSIYAYDDDYLYRFGTFGQKIEWMRANPNVCVEVDEVLNPQQWVSVVIFGQFEELPDSLKWRSAREYTHKKLLERNAIWWEPGYARTIVVGSERQLALCFYRIQITQIAGHRAIPAHVMPAGIGPSRTARSDGGWLQKIMRQVR